MRIVTRPIVRWPGELLDDSHRELSPFSASWGQTKELLAAEAGRIGATEIVLQLALSEDEIRLDGWPRAHARPAHPGVIVSLEGRSTGPLSFPCDRFRARYYGEEDWHANVRAVALAMEALRRVDRYGITRRGEQYVGWKPLEAGDGPSSAEAAARLLIEKAGGTPNALHEEISDVISDPEVRGRFYRLAAKRTHPDREGGSDEEFRAVVLALEVLS